MTDPPPKRKRERQQRWRAAQAEAGIAQINVTAHQAAHPIIRQIAQASRDGQLTQLYPELVAG
ncbi:hypothetical protein RM531_15920, partial [Salinisphaera sp. P385]